MPLSLEIWRSALAQHALSLNIPSPDNHVQVPERCFLPRAHGGKCTGFLRFRDSLTGPLLGPILEQRQALSRKALRKEKRPLGNLSELPSGSLSAVRCHFLVVLSVTFASFSVPIPASGGTRELVQYSPQG